MKLRNYQDEAVEAIMSALIEKDANPLCEVPTGGGKSVICAETIKRIFSEFDVRIIVFAHVKELVEQNAAAFCNLCPELARHVGVYSAGLGKKQTRKAITFASIQSVARNPQPFDDVSIVIVDECHLIPFDGDGQYRSFLDRVDAQVIGFSATPYRTTGGFLTTGDGAMFDFCCYRVDVLRLIDGGYLSPLTVQEVAEHYSTEGVNHSRGEYVQTKLASAIEGQAAVTENACQTIAEVGANRKKWIVFCTSIAHAATVSVYLAKAAPDRKIKVVTGKTDGASRDRIVRDFKRGKIDCIVNVAVFTTGFDAPSVDLVAILRPIGSPGLYVQICGRGMRVADGKTDCLLLDFGGNVERHGPINALNVRDPVSNGVGGPGFKVCADCYAQNHTAARRCKFCDSLFPIVEKTKLKARASINDPIERPEPPEWIELYDVVWTVHRKQDKPDSVKIEYYTGPGQAWPTVCEWLCLNHGGFAVKKAVPVFQQFFCSDSMTLDDWVEFDDAAYEKGFDDVSLDKFDIPRIVQAGNRREGLRVPKRILYGKETTKTGTFKRVMDRDFGDEPERDLAENAIEPHDDVGHLPKAPF